MHSSNFKGASASAAGREIAVIGSCNSAHDIAQDYQRHGAEVTMIQRSSTYVVSLDSTRFMMEQNYREDGVRQQIIAFLIDFWTLTLNFVAQVRRC